MFFFNERSEWIYFRFCLGSYLKVHPNKKAGTSTAPANLFTF